jgi:23S rRNA (pseudouridine1915-N3)-methyltransferase
MQKITLISVGRLKEDFFKSAEKEYAKRLGAFCDLKIIEVNQQQLPSNPSDGQIESALLTEAEDIISKIPKGSEVITLCIEGKLYSSEELSGVMADNANTGSGNMTFIIGGSFGLSEKVKALSKIRLSMSKMTFPHRLARVMLLEQIYRAFQIEAGSRYHK